MRDAILVGIGTVLCRQSAIDLPLARHVRALAGARGARRRCACRCRPSVVSTVRDTPTWVFTSNKASAIAEEILQQKGCKVFRVDDTRRPARSRRGAEGSGRRGHHPADGGGRPDASPAPSPRPIWSTKWRCCAAQRPSAPTASSARRHAARRRLTRRRSCSAQGCETSSVADTARNFTSGPDSCSPASSPTSAKCGRVKPRANNLHRITIACALSARRTDRGRLDRLLRRLPHRGRRRRGGRPHLVRASMPPPRRSPSPRSAAGGTARASISNARSKSATNSAAIWSPAMSTASPRDRARGHDRHGALRLARAAATCALHRAERLGRARRRLAHGQRGRGRYLLGADHPAHAGR